MKTKKLYIQQALLSFRKWSRKRFAVFASLNKVIKICTLLTTYSIINTVNPISAQSDTVFINNKIDLDEIEIIGQRSPGVYSDVARVITVISIEEIESAPVQSINDLFEFVPNIDLRQRGVLDIQADVGIRGGSFDQVLILLNGIPVNDPQTGHHNLNLPIDIRNIKKIEVLNGPGSRVYGANAFSGVINIITIDSNERSLKLSGSVGQHNYFNTALSGNYFYKNFYSNLSLSGKSSAGYIDNTDFKNYNLFYLGGLNLPIGKFEIQLGYLNKSFGANSFYTARFPEQYEQVRSEFAALSFSTGKYIKSEFTVAWRRHHDRFELFREDRYKFTNGFFINEIDTAKYNPNSFSSSSYYKEHNYHMTDILLFRYNNNFKSKLGNTSLGIEFKYEHIFSNLLGRQFENTIDAPGEKRGIFNKKAEREYFNVFFEHIIKYKKNILSGGVLASLNNDYGLSVYPGFEIARNINSSSKVFASFNQSMRLPTFTDLYYSGPTNIGNPDLKPEKSLSLETGFRKELPLLRIEISAFTTFGKDIIDWVKLPEDAIYTTRNFTHLNTYGIEFYSESNFNNYPVLNRFIQSAAISYCFLQNSKNSDIYISAYKLDYLKHKITAKMVHNLYKTFYLSWNITFQDRNGTYSGKDLTEHLYNPFIITNTKIYQKSKLFELYIEASNIFNVEYIDFGNIRQPGRWIIVGGIFSLRE